ncbi:hypothetical protein Tco_1465765 [Tanacetum coccineum]
MPSPSALHSHSKKFPSTTEPVFSASTSEPVFESPNHTQPSQTTQSQQLQQETKARTILLQSLPEDHMADFHHLDNARDIWLAIKARFGGNEESKKMRKSHAKAGVILTLQVTE